MIFKLFYLMVNLVGFIRRGIFEVFCLQVTIIWDQGLGPICN